MKITINEKKKLPLTYKYMEVYSERKTGEVVQQTTVKYIKISKIQSDFHSKSLPFKKLTRML